MITIDVTNSSAFDNLSYKQNGNNQNEIFATFTDKPETNYQYTEVPDELLEGLIVAQSFGRYFAQNIRHNKTIVTRIL